MATYTPDNIALGIIAEGRRSRSGEGQLDHPVMSDKGIKIAIATGLVETNLTMYANRNDPESLNYPYDKVGSDSKSSGVFQQQPPWWGTAADRMDVARSAAMFYNSLYRQKLNGQDYNTDATSPGNWAQMVQRSSFPDRYDQRYADATRIFNNLSTGIPAPPVSTPPVTLPNRPEFTEIAMFGTAASSRSRPPINFFIHTQEGSPDATAKDLAAFCQGQNGVSYHYTIRDGIVYDVVDTDLYSWSVLSANVFSINLCFAGSRAAAPREEWLSKYGRDIEIAAYLAVQDCRKYNFSTEVIAPPYHEASGVSDHKYVTQQLHIGDHTDVGNNFPWDVFKQHVDKYAGGVATTDPVLEMLAMPTNQEKLDTIYDELTKRFPSRAMYRDSDAQIDTVAGFALFTNGTGYDGFVEAAARIGESWALDKIAATAAGTSPGGRDPGSRAHAHNVLNSIDETIINAWNEKRSQ